ncbi:uncharacterized protein LOC122385342 [Amphibalanus amphitrite]|uniref:uncharacterized protein LOC122385342 n=1 Tax=Amphibalanus amphitrite TaxID=1232801 RepID=UPI001C920575|nr:uncharacterized protein LOC122385342 [Amphibalanus amphitrite]XP_043229480.1 uncharacterized protein LOC122385342 [Amphibalanus amphitrite]
MERAMRDEDGEMSGEMDFNESIIEAVRKYPGLWDKKSKDYAKKKTVKDLDWQRVAAECRCDVQAAKERWKSLRDYYLARKRKTLPSGSAAPAGGHQHLGPYGNMLRFLDPSTQRGPTTSSMTFRLDSHGGGDDPGGDPGAETNTHPHILYLEDTQYEIEVTEENTDDTPHSHDTTQNTSRADYTENTPRVLSTRNAPAQNTSRAHHTQHTTRALGTQHTPGTQGTRLVHDTTHALGAQNAPTQNTQRAHQTQHTTRAPSTQHTPGTQDTPSADDTHTPRGQDTQGTSDTQGTPRTTSGTRSKRKTTDIDYAILEELDRSRRQQSDRDYTFCMNVYAELQHRSEATKKLIKRAFQQILDEYED